MAKILIVDDSEAVRTQLKTALVSAGYEVIEAVDGRDGLEKAASQAPLALIISDLNMPRMDGITMCSKIKELETMKAVPIFMLTTESSPELKASGKAVGVTAWILKPLNPEKLLPVLAKVLNKPA